MIRKCFSFIPNLSQKQILELKSKNITWDNFLESAEGIFSDEEASSVFSYVNLAKQKLQEKDPVFFKNTFSKHDHILLFEHFLDSVAYIDIETTGLSKNHNSVTVIGVYDGKKTYTFVKGINLDDKKLSEFLSNFKMIVTFNGSFFDLPFIEHHFPSVSFKDKLHLDLRWVCKRAGLTGGLKNIEKETGISRDDELVGINGSMAVRLWKKYEKNSNKDALNLLVKYNQADVVNLEKLAKIVHSKLLDSKPDFEG